MEIKWKRYKTTSDYTLSKISYKNIFSLDVIEPPVQGLSKQPLSTMDHGIYKIYLKPDLFSYALVPRIKKIAGKPFFFVAPCTEVTNLAQVKHPVSTKHGFQFNLYAGKVNGESLAPSEKDFEKMITCMCIAMKQKECITINVQ